MLSTPVFGALDAAITWEIRQTGSQTNGGGFKTGATGTDYSQQDAPQWANEGITAAGAGTTVTDANAAATMVGNVMRVVSGTNATVGWYEITAATPGVSFTVDRNWCTGAVADGVCNIGGAFALGGSLDDDFFSFNVAGMTYWIKAGTHSLGEDVGCLGGSLTTRVTIEGYNTTRGDDPSGDNRPLINCGAYNFTTGNSQWLRHCRFTGTDTDVLRVGGDNNIFNVKSTNTEAVFGGRGAIDLTTGYCTIVGCEASSAKGVALQIPSADNFISGCYFHDSDDAGILFSSSGNHIENCIIESCLVGIDVVAIQDIYVSGCTIRGNVTGIDATTASSDSFVNNIIADNYVGASWDTEQQTNYFDYNLWYNNDTDVTNVTKGDNAQSTDPGFTSAVVEGTDGATDGAGTVFTAASAPFSGVDTGDTLVIVEAGTGATLGVYTISSVDSTSQLTLDSSAGASKTGVDYKIHKDADFTKTSSGGGNGNGLGPAKWTDATDNDPDIGGTPNTAAAASGGGVNKSGNKQ